MSATPPCPPRPPSPPRSLADASTAEALFRAMFFLPLYPEDAKRPRARCAARTRTPRTTPRSSRTSSDAAALFVGRWPPSAARAEDRRLDYSDASVHRLSAALAMTTERRAMAWHARQRRQPALQPRRPRRGVRRRVHRPRARRALGGAAAALGEPRPARVARRRGASCRSSTGGSSRSPTTRALDHARRSLPRARRGALRAPGGPARHRAARPQAAAPREGLVTMHSTSTFARTCRSCATSASDFPSPERFEELGFEQPLVRCSSAAAACSSSTARPSTACTRSG